MPSRQPLRRAQDAPGAQPAVRLRRSRRAIKVALLDQKVVAGIGNIYASEILHLAFGDAGKHARAALGVVTLPLDCPVELQLLAELLPGR